MRSFTTEAKVGLLVLAVLGTIFWAVRETKNEIAEDGDVYFTLLDNAAGLGASTRVQIAGVPVGQVLKVTEDGGKAKVKFRLEKGKVLPLDSTVASVATDMIGNRVIEIQRGASETGFFEPKAVIPAAPAEGDIGEILKRVDRIAQKVDTATGDDRLERIVADLAVFAHNLAEASNENRESIDRIVENMVAVSERLNQVIDHSGEDLDATFDELRAATAKLDSTLASTHSIAGKIDRGEGTIGRLVNDDETVEQLNTAIGGVNDVFERVNRTRVFVNYEGGMQVARAGGDAGQMKNSIQFRIAPHEDYGYLLGISDDPLGLRTRKTETVVVNGVKTVTETEKLSEDYLVTAQFYKRWGPVGGRIGMKESSGAIGVDAWLLKDKLKLSADAYQFSREKRGRYGAEVTENPRIRLAARYDVVPHLYLMGGVDDVISNYDRRAAFVGAGFEFNDDDLKYLMGSLPRP